jgi:S-adenosylmethionine:tRNA ribosyltransferase-isomerase
MPLLSQYDFDLPERLIAQEPLGQRTASRLLCLDRAARTLSHRLFKELPGLLREGDLLVRNETRVIPARLFGAKASGGRVELLLVGTTDCEHNIWRCICRSSKALRSGGRLRLDGGLAAGIVEVNDDGSRLVRFDCSYEQLLERLEQVGHVPLPPYIRRQDRAADRERYQTVFARNPGAVAAPTAGLHFSTETFAALAERGVEVCGLTLHVGPGTFQPVRSEELDAHRMHAEAYEVPRATAQAVNRARAEGRRIIALGTTVTRTLEAAVDDQGQLRAGQGETDIFIRPGFSLRTVDALITNFHLPRSTLLVLVAAFAGRELVLDAYRQAVAQEYRFFSYGDCMLIE